MKRFKLVKNKSNTNQYFLELKLKKFKISAQLSEIEYWNNLFFN